VLSLENLHDFSALRQELAARFGAAVEVREGVGAVAAIGAGINADFAAMRRSLELAVRLGLEVLGVSSSSFRISILLDARRVAELVPALHAELVATQA
jgi:aspartokinase